MLDIVAAWTKARLLLDFLNSWAGFEEDYKKTFFSAICPSANKSKAWRGRKIFTVLIYSYVFIPGILGSIVTYFSRTSRSALQFMIMVYLSFRLNAVELAEDAMCILEYRMITEGFDKIKQGIQMDLKFHIPNKSMVINWRHLLLT
ncbi:unnamed protein product, partial [Allacma fusca]